MALGLAHAPAAAHRDGGRLLSSDGPRRPARGDFCRPGRPRAVPGHSTASSPKSVLCGNTNISSPDPYVHTTQPMRIIPGCRIHLVRIPLSHSSRTSRDDKRAFVSVAKLVLLGALSCLWGCNDHDRPVVVKAESEATVNAESAFSISRSSSVLSQYGPSAGVLHDLLDIDMKGDFGVAAPNWQEVRCVWLFGYRAETFTISNHRLRIKIIPQRTSLLYVYYLDRKTSEGITLIRFD